MGKRQDREAVTLVVNDYDEARKHHDLFVTNVDKRYRAYRGVLERSSGAAQWTSKLHPPYVLQLVEAIVANLLDDRFRFRVNPRPRMAPPEEIAAMAKGARALEILLRHQLDLDNFPDKQRPYNLQNVIAGLTVGKTSWLLQERPRKRLRTEFVPILDEHDEPTGTHLPKLVEEERVEVERDDPTFEVVDVRDFLWHEAAVSLEASPFVIHRLWKTYDELKRLENEGVYKNVDDVKESRDFSGDELANRERDLFETDRTKDQIELLEYWTEGRTITVGNRRALFGDRPAPFWHGEKPFVVCSSHPDLFRIPGISVVERVAHIQEALWTLMNQRIDNLQLINNAIIILDPSIDDPDAFEFAPGEKWEAHPDQVKLWSPERISAEISLPAEALLRGDMQNITGGGLFLSGADSSSIDQKTATGVSIVTSLAARVLAAAKQQGTNSLKRFGQQWLELDQQFVREERLVQIVGPDGAAAFHEIAPADIQGRYSFELEAATESLMRQERRAEAGALYQLFLAGAQVHAALSQAGLGRALNADAFMERLLESYDIDDKERYFAAAPQPALPRPGTAPGAEGGNGAGGPTLGVTAPEASDESAPSNQFSISPEVAQQRAAAMGGGGGRNVG
jgi:hypothetical protein